MSRFRKAFSIGGLITMTFTTPAMAQDIKVRVTDIDTARPGNILVMLYGETGFPIDHDKAIEIKTIKAETSEVFVTFTVNEDPFAIKILHDEDEDGKTSKNWTGIWPKEGLGFSNGAKLSLSGAPKFKKAKLTLADIDHEIKIPVIYP